MKILIIATETIPYFKTGGLADVVYGFAKELDNQTHDARIIVPRYRPILTEPPELQTVIKDLKVDLGPTPTGSDKPGAYFRLANILKSSTSPITYFVDQDFYFSRDNLYGYPDDYERFIFFGLATLQAMVHPDFAKNEDGWFPDIIQGYDWATGLIPNWLRTFQDERYKKTRFVLGVHNIRRQGIFGSRSLQLSRQDQDGIYPDIGEENERVNFLGRGILFADKVVMVNPHFDELEENEIGAEPDERLKNRNPLPKPAQVLDPLLKKRLAEGDLVQIRNGIDEDDNDPSRQDPRIAARFTSSSLNERAKNKTTLQQILGFPIDETIPLLAMVSRLIPNNGYELLKALYDNREELKGFQLAILADSGATETRDLLRNWEEEQDPTAPWIKSRFSFDESLARQIYAGCDIFLIPAKEFPSGINQFVCMRYGAVPLVYHTGALCESVIQYKEGLRIKDGSGAGLGFKFFEHTQEAFLKAVQEALEVYHGTNQSNWRSIQLSNMRQRFNWGQPVNDYIDLYEDARNKPPVGIFRGQPISLNPDTRLLQAILEIDSLPGLGMREKRIILHQASRIIRGVLECDAVYVYELGDSGRLEALEPSLDYNRRKKAPDLADVTRLLNQNTINLWGSLGDADLNGICQPIIGLQDSTLAKQEGWVTGKSVPIVAHGHLIGRVDVLLTKAPQSPDDDWQTMALTALTSAFGQRLFTLQGAKERDDVSAMANEFLAARSFNAVVDLVCKWAKELAKAERVWLYCKKGEELELITPPNGVPGVDEIAKSTLEKQNLLSQVDWVHAPRFSNHRRMYRSLLAVPLIDRSFEKEEATVGSLVLAHSEPARFTHDHEQLLNEYLAPQAALALASSTWYQDLEKNRQRQIEGLGQTLEDFSQKLSDLYGVLAGSQDRQTLMNNIVEKIKDVVGVDAAALFLADDKRERLVIQAASGYQRKLMDADPKPFYLWGKGVTGRIAADNKPFIAGSLIELRQKGGGSSTKGNYDHLQDGLQPESFYGMPLSVENEKRPIGVLKVERLERQPFTKEDVRLITLMGNVIATVVYNAQISEQKLSKLSSSLQELSKVLVGGQAREVLMTNIVEKIKDVVGVDAASLFLADDKRERLVIQAASGYQTKLMDADPKPFYMWGKGVTGRIAADNKPFKADSLRELRTMGGDTKGNFDHLQDGLQPESFYGMPLSVEGENRPIGVLKVERLERRPFTAEEVLLIRMMGNVIATVVYNAQISEKKLADFSTNIRRLSDVLTPGVQANQQKWFQAIVGTISEIFITDAASLYLVDESNKRLVIAAASGYQVPLMAVKAFYEWDEGVTGHIAMTGNPARADTLAELRAGASKRGKYDDLQGGNQPNSYYGAPLKVTGEKDPIGVLKFESMKEKYFTDENCLLIDMMANVIATVIHNNRQSEKRIGRILQEMGTLGYPIDASPQVLKRYAEEMDAGLVNQLALALAQDLGKSPEKMEDEAKRIFEARKDLEEDLRAELFDRIASWAKFMQYDRVAWQYNLYTAIWRSNPSKFHTWQNLEEVARPWIELKNQVDDPAKFTLAAENLARLITQTINKNLSSDEQPLKLVNNSESRTSLFMTIMEAKGVFGEQVKNLLLLFQREGSPDEISQMGLDDLATQNPEHPYATLLIFLWNKDLNPKQIIDLRSQLKVRTVDVAFAHMTDLPHLMDPVEAKSYFRKLVLRQVTIVSPFRTEGAVPDNLFFGRDQEIKTLTHAPDAHDYAVIGNRKIGKTSLLERVLKLLERNVDILPIFIDCNAVTNKMDDFYNAVQAQTEIRLNENTPEDFERAIRELSQLGRFPVLLFDEIDRVLKLDADSGEPLVKTWRLLSQKKACRFIFFGSSCLAHQINQPKSDLYNFPKSIHLRYLNEETTRLVLTRPLEKLEVQLSNTDQIATQVFRFTSGHPNLVQLMGDLLVKAANQRQERRILLGDVEDVGKSSDFRDEYLLRIWGDASPLERLITLLAPNVEFKLSEIEEMLNKNGIYILKKISANTQAGASNCVFISQKMVTDAFRMLRLFSILEEKDQVYQFIPRSFPEILHLLPAADIEYLIDEAKNMLATSTED